ncbi:23S rRNA (uracil(1939)-C(5))-methyltransferase RlmD [Neisseria musculi]|uniref:23S rRNA (uracil(1939)-C(5))-methyltransferase RlmD n=1 Tax=Neisseria musculi TaxID=1815583 RepID=A0A7H1MB77_9NEIS|nr:23S rRNA (uracil(1939)-C(5))-methyltransferase RlmD [Neisseria musculi]QNT58892.1 23S rRNA (uracil-5-)-methyltransferase RumA [Neisseria musculi]
MKQVIEFNNTADVFSIDYEGRGVARINGKTVFIKGALPNERVAFRLIRSKKQFDEAEAVSIIRPSEERVAPKCCYFNTCGGCVLQHASPRAQVAFKQRILEEQLSRIGKVFPEQILPPVYGSAWGYRHRVRFSVSADKQGRVRVGFREKQSHHIVAIESCPVLPMHVSAILPGLNRLMQDFVKINGRVNYIECAVGEQLTILNVCMQETLEKAACKLLERFSDGLNQSGGKWQIWIQHGKKAAYPLCPENAPEPAYRLPEFDVEMPFLPGDFTQINTEMNALMVGRALRLLDARPNERVADLFCGLGNFTLPIAKSAAEVVGLEEADYLVRRARSNAALNGCTNAKFRQTDLFATTPATVTQWGYFDKMLLDPPRAGAYAVTQALHAPYLPKRIVYVSCNPSTLARDAAVLAGKGYCFKAAGVINMFAQTAHVESIAWFELH